MLIKLDTVQSILIVVAVCFLIATFMSQVGDVVVLFVSAGVFVWLRWRGKNGN